MGGQLVDKVCDHCGKGFLRFKHLKQHKRTFCSVECYNTANSGAGHRDYAGGRWMKTGGGYVMLTLPGGKRKAEHIAIAEKALGRMLRHGEIVHHINGCKHDNRNTNLLICTRDYHSALHAAMSMKYAAMLET